MGLDDLEASSGNDCWGWTDPATGKEYAIMGVDNGTVFIDISDPENPIYTVKVLTTNQTSAWRDIKTYNNFAFIVSEAGGHGMQIFDLTRLRDSGPFDVFSPDANYGGFGNAHNIVINEDTGYAYAVGTDTFGGGIHFVNIQNPLNPIPAGGYSTDGYTHDAQVVTYNGPDTNYTGREILFGSNETKVVIVDVTDKANPQNIANIFYSDTGYTHQCWLTEDHRFLIVGDELDELTVGFQSRTLIFDLENLNNPQSHFDYFGPTFAIDHNLYVKGNKLYLSNYTAGLRVIDISFIGSSGILEEGYFDTYPDNDAASFNGAWSVYPYFESGHIVISDINKGLFIVKKKS